MKTTGKYIKTAIILSMIAFFALNGGNSSNIRSTQKTPKTKIVELSSAEWSHIKKEMDKKGVYWIENQNVLLVLTNEVSEVEHILTHGGNRQRERRPEPMPYDGQGL